MNESKFITSKNVFGISLLIVAITIIFFWLFGIRNNNSIKDNSILSASTLTLFFFLFLFISLYRGVKLKDNLGKITDRFDSKKLRKLDFAPTNGPDAAGDGIEGIIFGFILWILVTIIVAIAFWIFGAIIWFSVLVFLAMLYWVFFRALRLVFKHSKICAGNLGKSLIYSLGYSVLYTSWIFGIIHFSAFR